MPVTERPKCVSLSMEFFNEDGSLGMDGRVNYYGGYNVAVAVERAIVDALVGLGETRVASQK